MQLPERGGFFIAEAAGLAGAGAFLFGEGIAEFGAGGFDVFHQIGDFFGMSGGEVAGFAGIGREIVEGESGLAVLIGGGEASVASRFAVEGAVGVG